MAPSGPEYGFRHDPMVFVEGSDSLQAALVRRYVVGDAKLILKEMVQYIEPRERNEWFAWVEHMKQRYPLTYDNDGDSIKPQYVIEEVGRQTLADIAAIVGAELPGDKPDGNSDAA